MCVGRGEGRGVRHFVDDGLGGPLAVEFAGLWVGARVSYIRNARKGDL